MARFRGLVKGARKEVTLLGHSFMTTEAQSWDGKIVTRLSVNEAGKTCVVVSIEPHFGKGEHRIIFNGEL